MNGGLRVKTNFGCSPRSPFWIALAAALAVACREYDLDHPNFTATGGSTSGGDGATGDAGSESGSGGTLGETGGTDGSSGVAGADGGRAGADDGGGAGASGGGAGADGGGAGDDQGGRDTGGTGGSGNSGATGGSAGGGAGGVSGSGTTGPEPGTYGAVRVLVDGERKCGGSLLTNDWVLTADQCVLDTVGRGSILIGFGMDSERFQQTRGVIEIQRFPGNTGNEGSRGHDLLLLGVDRPFEIDGRTSGFFRPLWAASPEAALRPHRCVGWDLRVAGDSPTTKLHEEFLTPFTFDLQTTNIGGRPSGSRVWWLNASDDPALGVLPMPADVGSACFLTWFDWDFLATVHSGNPPVRRDGRQEYGREAYSVALGERAVRTWLGSVLFDAVVEEIELGGDPGVCSSRSDRIDLFGRLASGDVGWFTWDGSTWTERTSLPAPSGVTFVGESPGAYCANGGGIELFVTSVDGDVWWRRMAASEEWNDEWVRVPDVMSPVDSGIAVTGVLADHFFVFARAASGELRYAEYDGDWKHTWTDLGGVFTGTPAALMTQEGRIDVFARTLATDEIRSRWMHNTNWQGWSNHLGRVSSDPTVVSWGNQHLDLMTRSLTSTVGHSLCQSFWNEPIETTFPMPPGKPSAVARRPGTTDVFVTQSDGRIWHGTWPREPL